MGFFKNELKISTDVSSIKFRFNPDISKWYIQVNGHAMCHFNSFIGSYKRSYFESLTLAVAHVKARGVLPENFKVEDLPLPKVIVK